jgi:[ribosomal protein S5]-alanine N-acetyltransferase
MLPPGNAIAAAAVERPSVNLATPATVILGKPSPVTAMNFPERIETDRLILRWPTEADAGELFARCTSDVIVTKYLLWRVHPSVEETVAQIRKRRGDNHRFSWLVLPKSGAPLLGSIGCNVDQHTVQFGYYFAQNAWGHGYATETARRMVEIWLGEPAIWRVQAFCDPENAASARVLEKAGLTYEGTLRKYALAPNISSVPCDVRLYAIVREAS